MHRKYTRTNELCLLENGRTARKHITIIILGVSSFTALFSHQPRWILSDSILFRYWIEFLHASRCSIMTKQQKKMCHKWFTTLLCGLNELYFISGASDSIGRPCESSFPNGTFLAHYMSRIISLVLFPTNSTN